MVKNNRKDDFYENKRTLNNLCRNYKNKNNKKHERYNK
jgi:hypothetical protein